MAVLEFQVTARYIGYLGGRNTVQRLTMAALFAAIFVPGSGAVLADIPRRTDDDRTDFI